MSKRLIGIFLGLLIICKSLSAQKMLIDTTVFGKWPSVKYYSLSNDGRFLYYTTKNPSLSQDTLFARSTDGIWQVHFDRVKYAYITQDSKTLIFQRSDSIFQVELGSYNVHYITNILGEFHLLPLGKNDDLLIFSLAGSPSEVVARDALTDKERKFTSLERYWSSAVSAEFIVLTKENQAVEPIYHLRRIGFADKDTLELFRGANVSNLVFNRDANQIAFLSTDSNGVNSIWHYRFDTGGRQKAVKLMDDRSVLIAKGLKINELIGFSKASAKLYFSLAKVGVDTPHFLPGVDIYSYKDPTLQSLQLYSLKSNASSKGYTAVINVSNGSIIQLDSGNYDLLNTSEEFLPESWALLSQKGKGDFYEWNWNKEAKNAVFLLSLKTGQRKLLFTNPRGLERRDFQLSPDEKYLVFYDALNSAYFSLELTTGIINNLSHGIGVQLTIKNEQPASKYSSFGQTGFTSDHRYVLINTEYDIYKLDLSGKRSPVNLTEGYGQSHQVVFRVDRTNDDAYLPATLILSAFNNHTKDQGFFTVSTDSPRKLNLLTMQPAKLSIAAIARDTPGFLIKHETEKSFPNIAYSSDLKHFDFMTNVHPEKRYNWLTAELISWQLPNGTTAQGVLYKPENFDPQKKYPLILHYYETLSKNLHQFHLPEAMTGEINIPFYVSNGYLVFLPDIHYEIGHPGRSAFNIIHSAALMLSKRRYVDPKRMGLQGLSFGGFETNYAITHTQIFSAAVSISGMTDFVSAYGSIIGDGTSRQRQYELYRDRIGTTLWQRPDLYIENSPIFLADRIKTPLLMMANKLDGDVPCQQGIELFTALRRLQKKAWMLQYDEGGHVVYDKASKDLTIRVFQFFNYYLKSSLPPVWMTIGIPATQKGIENGLDPDLTGAIP